MRILIVLGFTLFSTILTAQSNYYFGYQDGFKYGCQCNDLPSKNVAYLQGTYNEGYTAGKIDGVIYFNQKSQNSQQTYTSKPHDYNNQPVYNPDYEAIEKALSEKQQLVNERRKDVVNRVDNILNIAAKVKEKKGSFTEDQLKFLKKFNDNLGIIEKYDYSIYQNYLNAVNWLKQIENEIFSWF